MDWMLIGRILRSVVEYILLTILGRKTRLQSLSLVEVTKTLDEVPAGLSVLALLQWMISTMFKDGQDPASILFCSIRATAVSPCCGTGGPKVCVDVSQGRSEAQIALAIQPEQWKSCKLAATLVLLLAASTKPESLFDALKSQSRSLGGLPTLGETKTTPSASFRSAFQKAKSAAVKDGKTTVLAVSLTDVHIFELVEQGLADQYFSFAHMFAIGIGPAGVVVWQAWGKHGYSLDEYIRDGHGRLRSWDEAEQLVKDFEKLASSKGTWREKINKMYEKLFLVDINRICGPGGPERPVTPKFKAWVRIHTIEDVKREDVTKFTWHET